MQLVALMNYTFFVWWQFGNSPLKLDLDMYSCW